MPLQPGTTLGAYAVTAKIGMWEVCRARDTKLDRDAALKFFPTRPARVEPQQRW